MATRKATRTAVFEACDALEATGETWGRNDVIAHLGGGSASTIAPLMKLYKELKQRFPSNTLSVLNIEKLVEIINTTLASQIDPALEAFDDAQQAFDEVLDDLTANLTASQHEQDRSAQLLAERSEQLTKANNTLDMKARELVRLADNLSDMEQRLKEIHQAKIEQRKALYDEKEKALALQGNHFHKELAEVMTRVQASHKETLNSLKDTHTAEKMELEERLIAEHDTRMSELNARLSANEKTLMDLKAEHSQREAKQEAIITSLRTQLSSESNKLAAQAARHEELSTTLTRRDQEIKEQRDRHENELRRQRTESEKREKQLTALLGKQRDKRS